MRLAIKFKGAIPFLAESPPFVCSKRAGSVAVARLLHRPKHRACRRSAVAITIPVVRWHHRLAVGRRAITVANSESERNSQIRSSPISSSEVSGSAIRLAHWRRSRRQALLLRARHLQINRRQYLNGHYRLDNHGPCNHCCRRARSLRGRNRTNRGRRSHDRGHWRALDRARRANGRRVNASARPPAFAGQPHSHAKPDVLGLGGCRQNQNNDQNTNQLLHRNISRKNPPCFYRQSTSLPYCLNYIKLYDFVNDFTQKSKKNEFPHFALKTALSYT